MSCRNGEVTSTILASAKPHYMSGWVYLNTTLVMTSTR
jgi:hypothetical protein